MSISGGWIHVWKFDFFDLLGNIAYQACHICFEMEVENCRDSRIFFLNCMLLSTGYSCTFVLGINYRVNTFGTD